MFEGITYCDYGKFPFVCKPHKEMYEKAEAEARAPSVEECYFVGETWARSLNSNSLAGINANLISAHRRLSPQLPPCP